MELGMVGLERMGASRSRSREHEPFADRLLAMMRHQFGGCAIEAAEGKEK